MAIAIQSLVLNFAAMQVFLYVTYVTTLFSDRNTSFYHMTWEFVKFPKFPFLSAYRLGTL